MILAACRFDGIDAPICQDDRLGGLDVCLARSIVCHDPLVDLAGEEAFEAPDDIACGPAASSPSYDVVDGRLVESHADDDGSIEGGVGLSVATPIEAVPAGGHPGRGRDRTRAAELREALLHESSLARTMPTDRILTCRCDTTPVGRGRSSD